MLRGDSSPPIFTRELGVCEWVREDERVRVQECVSEREGESGCARVCGRPSEKERGRETNFQNWYASCFFSFPFLPFLCDLIFKIRQLIKEENEEPEDC